MSGIAELLLNLDFTITGSDINKSQNVNRLETRGVKYLLGIAQRTLIMSMLWFILVQ